MVAGMTNAAYILAELLEAVDKAGGQVSLGTCFIKEAERREVTADELHLQIANYFSQVRDDIDALEAIGMDVSIFKATLPKWQHAVVGGKQGWKTTQAVRLLSEAELNILRLFAEYHTHALPSNPATFSDADKTFLQDLLVEVAEFLDSQALPPSAHGWFKINVKKASTVLEAEPIASDALVLAFANIIGAQMLAATGFEKSDPEKAKRFRDKARETSAAFSKIVAIAATTELTTSGIAAVLTAM